MSRTSSRPGTPLRPSAALLALALSMSACAEAGLPAPAADLSEELTGGSGPFIGAAGSASLPPGYEVHEFVAAGTASAYAPVDSMLDDGRWTFEPTTEATYRTRVLVRRPSDPSTASGTVIVEWLNVSGGVDADPDYANLVEEIVRRGHVWVGVSAQIVGVEGGTVLVGTGGDDGLAGLGLKGIDPARYASLVHPGDGYSFDIFTQVARALRRGGTVLGGIRPRLLIAAGESQSAMALTTYYNGVQPLTHAFDAFFVHSRAWFALPLVEPGQSADLITALSSSERPWFRDDLAAPVMELQAEGDAVGLLSSSLVRQPDTATFRLWEVAGTAHADRHLLGAAADSIDCMVPVNDGPMHLVAKAAFRRLETWAREGDAPPIGARLDVDFNDGGAPLLRRDADGIVLGGIRTPPVDVPVDVLSGAPGSASILCLLLGSTLPLSDTRIAELYSSRTMYEQLYGAATDEVILAGFVLEDDRDALIDFAQPLRVAP